MNKTYCLILAFLLSTSLAFAQQNFKYTAALPKIAATGSYKILLSTDVLAKCRGDLGDLRILDQNKKFVSYILNNQSSTIQQTYIELSLRNSVALTDTSTIFVVENFSRLTIDQLILKIRNTSVQRTVNLSGSDDLKKWYAIKENNYLAAEQTDNTGVFRKTIDFPFSNYRYFKIELPNKHKEPINILEVGVQQAKLVKPQYLKLDTRNIVQKDSNNISLVKLTLKDKYPVNLLHFNIEGSKYFKRAINIYQIEKGKRNLLFSGNITSEKMPEAAIATKTVQIEVEINNGDNPPLIIKSIDAYQTQQALISYLEKDHQYQLLFGNTAALIPRYDLGFFKDSLLNKVIIIKAGAVNINPSYQLKKVENKSVPSWILWIAMAFVLVLLTWLTLKMTQEVSKRSAAEKADLDE